jgi:hypothetical protein
MIFKRGFCLIRNLPSSSPASLALPIFARSMKQNRYSKKTVGMMYKSIFNLTRASSFLSNVTSVLPYLSQQSDQRLLCDLE